MSLAVHLPPAFVRRRPRRESPITHAAHPDSAAVQQAIEAAGATTSLVVGEGVNGRGLFTTSAAKEGDLLLRVPLRHALCVTTSGSKAFVENLLRKWREDGTRLPADLEAVVTDTKLPPEPRLAVWLLWARRNSAVWQAADALLPGRSFSVAAAAELAEETLPVLSRGGLAGDADSWLWALSCIASRTFGADAWTRGERDGLLGLHVPVADLLNHGFEPNCQFRLRADAAQFEVFARRAINEGEEACITYGEDLSNDELLRRYGFTLGTANPNGDVTPPPKKRINW